MAIAAIILHTQEGLRDLLKIVEKDNLSFKRGR